MISKQTTRRAALKVVGATLPAVLASSTYASAGAKAKGKPTIGISTPGFGNLTNAQLAYLHARQHLRQAISK